MSKWNPKRLESKLRVRRTSRESELRLQRLEELRRNIETRR